METVTAFVILLIFLRPGAGKGTESFRGGNWIKTLTADDFDEDNAVSYQNSLVFTFDVCRFSHGDLMVVGYVKHNTTYDCYWSFGKLRRSNSKYEVLQASASYGWVKGVNGSHPSNAIIGGWETSEGTVNRLLLCRKETDVLNADDIEFQRFGYLSTRKGNTDCVIQYADDYDTYSVYEVLVDNSSNTSEPYEKGRWIKTSSNSNQSTDLNPFQYKYRIQFTVYLCRAGDGNYVNLLGSTRNKLNNCFWTYYGSHSSQTYDILLFPKHYRWINSYNGSYPQKGAIIGGWETVGHRTYHALICRGFYLGKKYFGYLSTKANTSECVMNSEIDGQVTNNYYEILIDNSDPYMIMHQYQQDGSVRPRRYFGDFFWYINMLFDSYYAVFGTLFWFIAIIANIINMIVLMR
jgi:hypothetical protein